MITILQYKGTSLISRLIQWQTRSVYSHSAAMLNDCTVIEAWTRGGVSHVTSKWGSHSPGTEIDIFSVAATIEQEKQFEDFLLAQVGKGYDFRSVFRFLTRSGRDDKDRWFCSELVVAGLQHAGLRPFNCRAVPSKISPGMLALSPILIREK